MVKRIKTYIDNYPLAILLVFGFLLRLFLYFSYQHATLYPDSNNYIELAKVLTSLNLDGYTGERTPGFPVLIALVGNNLTATVLLQAALGLLGIYFLFDFCKRAIKNTTKAFWITFITNAFVHVVFFEFAILTESLTYLLILAIFWYIEKYQLLQNNTALFHYLIISLLFGYLYFTRPFFIYFPFLFFGFYILKNILKNWRKTILKALVTLVIPLLCFYSWSSLNERNIGYFASTYYLGINLSQNATSFFHKAPDEDALIRDIFVKHRDDVAKNEAAHQYPMSVWYAYPELLEKTQLSPPDLSNELGRISKELFKKHPDLYLKQVAISWKDFWTGTPLVWEANHIQNKYIRKGLILSWLYIFQYLLIIINLLFLAFSIKKIIAFLRKSTRTFDIELFIVLLVLAGSILQALVVYGSNSRFSFPYFPFIVYFVIANLISLKTPKQSDAAKHS